MEDRSWAKNALDGGAEQALYCVQKSLPVSLIASPRSEFVTCAPTDRIVDLVVRNQTDDFDYLPVEETVGATKSIVGVLQLEGRKKPSKNKTVLKELVPLGESLLIGADASILTFISEIYTKPFRFLVAGECISGLVTISDLQQLPVRIALFAFVTQLEMVMADVIRDRFTPEQWMALLSKNQRDTVEHRMEQAAAENTLVEKLLYTNYRHKVAIIAGLWTELDLPVGDRKRFKDELDRVADFRNQLAHAQEFASSREQAITVCEHVCCMSYWLDELEKRRIQQPAPTTK